MRPKPTATLPGAIRQCLSSAEPTVRCKRAHVNEGHRTSAAGRAIRFRAPAPTSRIFEDRIAPAVRTRRRVDDAPVRGGRRRAGRRSERDIGIHEIRLDSIVGTVGAPARRVDRKFRPTSPGVRWRWERIATARRRGQSHAADRRVRIGELHFVQDGHTGGKADHEIASFPVHRAHRWLGIVATNGIVEHVPHPCRRSPI